MKITLPNSKVTIEYEKDKCIDFLDSKDCLIVRFCDAEELFVIMRSLELQYDTWKAQDKQRDLDSKRY